MKADSQGIRSLSIHGCWLVNHLINAASDSRKNKPSHVSFLYRRIPRHNKNSKWRLKSLYSAPKATKISVAGDGIMNTASMLDYDG